MRGWDGSIGPVTYTVICSLYVVATDVYRVLSSRSIAHPADELGILVPAASSLSKSRESPSSIIAALDRVVIPVVTVQALPNHTHGQELLQRSQRTVMVSSVILRLCAPGQ